MNPQNETAPQVQGTPSSNPWQGEATPQYDLTPKEEVKSSVQQAPVETPVEPPKQALMDADTIRTIVQETARASQPAPLEKQMSMEEFNKLMNVYQVTPEQVQQLGLQPEAANILHAMLQGIAKQAVTMAEFRIRNTEQNLRKTYDDRLTPLQSFVEAQREQTYRAEFFEQNKDLVGWEPLLETTYTQLKTEGKQFQTKEAAYKEIAERARAIIKRLPASASPAATTTPTSNGSQGHKMSTLTGGGQGGAGGSKPVPSTQAKSIFG